MQLSQQVTLEIDLEQKNEVKVLVPYIYIWY